MLRPLAFALVLGVTAVRVVIATNAPLTPDEAYYWSWLQHPAFGYVDHPPGVMLTIRIFSFLGHSTLAVRLGSILEGALTALFVGGVAQALSQDRRAGAIAAIAFALLPQSRFFAGEALPDSPFLMCWSGALWCAARCVRDARPRDAALLGLALGGACLSRAFGWALVAGIAGYAITMPRQSGALRRALFVALPVAGIVYLPFVLWNATHGWVNFSFTLADRQKLHAILPLHLDLSSIRCLVYGSCISLAAIGISMRFRIPLIAWTAMPLTELLMLLAFVETVESYWLLGPVLSVLAGSGIAFVSLAASWRWLLAAAYAAASAIALATAGFPALATPVRAALIERFPATRPLCSETESFAKAAPLIAKLARERAATPITDTYEVAALLTFYGSTVRMAGHGLGATQWEMWQRDIPVPGNALLLRDKPFVDRDPFVRFARRTWARVRVDRTIYADVAPCRPRPMYTELASHVQRGGERTLRF